MKPEKVTVKKIFRGHISIRDYIVERAKTSERGIEVWFLKRQEVMYISPDKLDKGKNLTDREFYSQYSHKPYKLIDFEWKPQGKQRKLL